MEGQNALDQQEFKVYKYRYLVLFAYFMQAFSNIICMVTFVTIINQVSDIFEVPKIVVIQIVIIFPFLYVIFSLPSNYVLENKGFLRGMQVGIILQVLGALLRMLIFINFYLIYIGTVLCAIAQPFIMNANVKMPPQWFPPQQRTMATTVACFGQSFGGLIGLIVPALFVSGKDKADVVQLIIFEGIFVLFFGVIGLILLRDKPPTPPSNSESMGKLPFKKSIRYILKQRNFYPLLITFTLNNSISNGLGNLVSQLLDPYGFSPMESVAFILCLVTSGIIGTSVFSCIVDKYKNYKFMMSLSLISSAFLLTLLLFILQVQSLWWLLPASAVAGFMIFPSGIISQDLSCEVCYPIGESVTGGFLTVVSSLFQVPIVYIMAALCRDDTSAYVILFAAIVQVIACISFWFFREDLRRLKVDRCINTQQAQQIIDQELLIVSKNPQKNTELSANIQSNQALLKVNQQNSSINADTQTQSLD